jgi:hypothetical protein
MQGLPQNNMAAQLTITGAGESDSWNKGKDTATNLFESWLGMQEQPPKSWNDMDEETATKFVVVVVSIYVAIYVGRRRLDICRNICWSICVGRDTIYTVIHVDICLVASCFGSGT